MAVAATADERPDRQRNPEDGPGKFAVAGMEKRYIVSCIGYGVVLL